jgi:uncharacterized protein YjiS (DUF1127 family)
MQAERSSTGLRALFHRWRRRVRMRRELAALGAHERRDINMRWEDALAEASKPFWRR